MARGDPQHDPRAERVLILAPAGRDGPLAARVLTGAGLACAVCGDIEELDREYVEGAGVILMTAEALTRRAVDVLEDLLVTQPDWSELLLVVLDGKGQAADHLMRLRDARTGDHITALDRPVRGQVLVSVLRSAVQIRRRQYEVRDLLAQLEHTKGDLERRVAERTAALHKKTRQVRSLAAALTDAEQRERKRISRILHDHLQQVLVGLRMHIQLLRDEPAAKAVRDQLIEFDGMTGDAIQITRTLTVELSPPVLESDGMKAGLEWLASQMERTHNLRVGLEVDDGACDPSGRDQRVLLFQLVRELLFNIVKHAGVDEAEVRMWCEGGWCLIRVVDRGAGFDPAAAERNRSGDGGGFGLSSMRERIDLFRGKMEVDSAPGRGTRITLSVPQPGDETTDSHG